MIDEVDAGGELDDVVVTALLVEAADHLHTHGWVQCRPGSLGQPCCMVGAIDAILAHRADRWRLRAGAVQRIRAYLVRCDLYDAREVYWLKSWNDLPGRTHAEVDAVLRGAARTAA